MKFITYFNAFSVLTSSQKPNNKGKRGRHIQAITHIHRLTLPTPVAVRPHCRHLLTTNKKKRIRSELESIDHSHSPYLVSPGESSVNCRRNWSKSERHKKRAHTKHRYRHYNYYLPNAHTESSLHSHPPIPFPVILTACYPPPRRCRRSSSPAAPIVSSMQELQAERKRAISS